MQQRYPAPYGERMSPNQLCNVPVLSPLCTLLRGPPASPEPPNAQLSSSHLQIQALMGLDPSLSHSQPAVCL